MSGHEVFQPSGTIPTFRDEIGYTHLTRATTTEEQRTQAVEHALKTMQARGADELRIEVQWTRGEPTILEVRARVETLAGGVKLYCEDESHEFTLTGGPADLNAGQRSQRTLREVSEMAEAGML